MDDWMELTETRALQRIGYGLVLVFIRILVAINYNTNIERFIGLYNWTFTLISSYGIYLELSS
jgi:hypothetical protein